MHGKVSNQLLHLSRAFDTTSIVWFLASSTRVLSVIHASILDPTLSSRFTFSVISKDSQPQSKAYITNAWKRRSLGLVAIFGAAKMCLSALKAPKSPRRSTSLAKINRTCIDELVISGDHDADIGRVCGASALIIGA